MDKQEDCNTHVKKALDFGINFFDTANIYSSGVSEMMTGQAIKSLAKREEIIIATKVGLPMPDGSSPRGLSKDLIEKHVH